MIGNDIVDLTETRLNSNWQRRGFLEKVFSSEEQQIISTSSNPFQTVWRMWSMKESGYKFYLQKHANPIKGFYPAKISCQLHNSEMGAVTIQGTKVNTKTITHSDYLFSTTFLEKNILPKTEIFYIPEKNHQFQSTFVREKLVDFFVQNKQLDKAHFKIRKGKTGIPYFYYKSALLPIALSLTHHGNYGGFSVTHLDD